MDDADIQLALAHHKAGRFVEAQNLYRQILTANPRQATVLNYHGVLAIQTQQIELAIKLLRRAVAINPNDAHYHCNLGEALRQSSRVAASIECFREAIRLSPQLAVAHNNLGIALAALGEAEQAIESYKRAIEIAPDYAEAHGNLGNALKEMGRFDEAVAECRIAVKLKPQNAECHNQLGAALAAACEFDEAVGEYRTAIRIDPRHADAHSNLGNALAGQGRVQDAVASCATAVQLRPESIPAHWNFAVALLRAGDYSRGWVEHEWRLRSENARFTQPRWDGGALMGKTLLVHAEQGFGDTIQFARYVVMVAAHVARTGGGRIVLECHRALVRLLEDLPGLDQVIASGDASPHFDEHIPLMSLPLLFRTRLESVTATVPYVRAKPLHVDQWKDRVRGVANRESTLHVGLCWTGSASHRNDHERSIPFDMLGSLKIEGVIFHSLQKEPVPTNGLNVIDHSPLLADFAETAALIANLDQVISVDTAVAHLGGALGVATSLLLPHVPDWRWMLHRQDCAWYPTIRLFRQRRISEWPEVLQRVRADMARLGTLSK